jgi:hypothetical protein
MVVDGQVVVEDYFQAKILHLGNRRAIGFIVVAIGSVFLISSFSGGIDQFLLPRQLFAAAFLIVAAWRYTPWEIRRKAARDLARNVEMQSRRHFVITENGLMVTSESGEKISASWDDYIKWNGNDVTALVYIAPGIYNIFPRRWFASDADFTSMKELLAKTIGPMGKARKISA